MRLSEYTLWLLGYLGDPRAKSCVEYWAGRWPPVQFYWYRNHLQDWFEVRFI